MLVARPPGWYRSPRSCGGKDGPGIACAGFADQSRGELMRAAAPFLALALLATPAPAALPARDAPTVSRRSIALTLDQALALARARSSDVARARRNAEISRLQVRSARSLYQPSASVTVSANQSARGSVIRFDGDVFRQGVEGNFLGGASLSASLPIDLSGIIGPPGRAGPDRRDGCRASARGGRSRGDRRRPDRLSRRAACAPAARDRQ